MNYEMHDAELKKLYKQHAKAKKKMVRGIVFTSIGYVLLFTIYFTIIGIVFLAIGIPGIVNGAKARHRANRRISDYKKYQANAFERDQQFAYQPAQQPIQQPTADEHKNI